MRAPHAGQVGRGRILVVGDESGGCGWLVGMDGLVVEAEVDSRYLKCSGRCC